jgi:hypothetical protein
MALFPWHHSLFICSPNLRLLLSLCSLLSADRLMEDLTDVRNSTKSTDEKHSIEDSESVTQAWFTSAANVARNFSEMLLAWGVEERGAYPILNFEHGQT